MRYVLTVAASLLLLVGCAHPQPSGERQMENWNSRHPEAARELCNWVGTHPEAANHFFEWDASHPERAREFVTWTIAHPPAEGINVFVVEHRAWSEWDWISEQHHPAANAFMGWCRRHPRAAEDLVNHPAGLRWAGHHFGC
jgi:hypothetical protein